MGPCLLCQTSSSEKTPNLGLFCIQLPQLGGEFTEFAAVIKNPFPGKLDPKLQP